MEPWLIVVFAIVGVLILLGIWLAVSASSLAKHRARVDEAWRELTTQLQQRAELVPSLVDQVRGFADHESATLGKTLTACEVSRELSDPKDASKVETQLQECLQKVYRVADDYPKLQSSREYLEVRSRISDSENRMQSARRYYNGSVREYNLRGRSFPGSMVASMRGYSACEPFEVETKALTSAPPKIDFG